MPIYFLKQANSGDDLFILSSSHGGLAKVLDSIALKNGIHGIIKGSNNRNSYGAMSKIVKTLESGKSLCITPDGPRGPRMILKNNNIIELAIKLNIPIATCNYAVKYSKSLRSWDRMMLPLPLPFNKGIFYVKEITNQSYYMQHNNVNDVAEFVSNEMNRISNICHKYCGIKKIKPSKYSYKRKRK